MRFKCISVVGARPQFIKAAPVSRMMKKSGIKEILVHTGQHYDYNMSGIFFKELGIRKPDYNLGVGSLPHGAQTGKIMERFEEVLLKEEPQIVLVYGDTNSTLACALAAAKLHIPVAHVEAGLRSYNRWMPEEINRVLTDHVSDILFCPTKIAVKNLQKEGFRNIVNKGKLVGSSFALHKSSPLVVNVGDVMYDSVLFNIAVARRKSKVLKAYNLSPKQYYLATIHRAENTDDISRLTNIFKAFDRIGREYPLIVPLHPRTTRLLSMIGRRFNNITIISPQSYLDMLMLSGSARVILTDSGGLQKEACFLNVPCVTLRDETEWIETLKGKMNILAGATEAKILKAVGEQRTIVGQQQLGKSFFGNGNASEKIITVIKKFNLNTLK